MVKRSSSFQRNIKSITLRALICFALIRFCGSRNSFSDLDLSTQTLNPIVTGFKITGNAVNDYLGFSVSTAGDINHDGYDDIIVGAIRKNGLQGAVYVIYGGQESSFLNFDLSTTSLNPSTTGFTITGNAANDQFGYSVRTAGDINNDGYDDIIVGAIGKNGFQGAAYVIYGGDTSTMSNIILSSTTLIPASTGFTITGNAANDYFGYSVSTAGDINNDGYDDIIIGAHVKNTAYVIYGGEKSTRSNIILSSTTLNPLTTGFMVTGNAVGDVLGFSVSTAGDINNDGYDDIIVGAAYKNSQQGAVYVIYGGPKSAMSNIVLSSTPLNPLTTGFMVLGNAAGDIFGWQVNTAGDINGDGYDDIIVGAYRKNSYQGAAYVIYGGPKSSMSNILLSSTTLIPASTGFMITGNAAAEQFGISVSTAGDINNDGYDDIIIGADGKNSGQGAAYVIYGGEKSTRSNIVLSSTPLNPLTTGFMVTGNAAGDVFGWFVSTAGDINGDGYNDIIVGAYFKNSYQGAAYVIYASCPMNCKQCSSESVCTECKNPYLLYQSHCFASCPDATLATSTSTCEDCPTYCNICSSTSVCTECKNPYILYQSQCLDSCPDTMFLSTTTCEDCPAHCNHCTNASLCTECISPFVLYDSQCLTSCPNAMFNSDNVCKDCPSYCSSCTSQDSCQICYQGFTLSNSLCVLSLNSSLQAQQRAYQAISSVTQGIGSVVCVGSVIFPFSALVSKIVQNTRYLNLSVANDLTEVYQTWNTNLISLGVPDAMSDLDHFKASPSLFAQYNLGSPFLTNFWPTFLNIGIGFSIFIACILLQKIFEHEKYEGWAYSLVRKLVSGSFNFALIQAYACFDEILFYLVLDAKTNPFNSFFSWVSIICAVLFLALGCLLVFFNFWTVKKYQGIKNQGAHGIEAFNERNKYWQLFYSDFNDDNLWSQSFFAILIIRSSLSSFMIIALYDYPLMQTPYLVIMDVAIISFLYLKDPFNTLRGKLAQYYYEIITLMVHLCTFILSLQDSFENPSETVKIFMSTGILYLNTPLVSGAIGFMFIEIYKTISEKKRAERLKQRQSAPEDIQETQNLTSLFHPTETNVQKRQDSIYQEESKSIENYYFSPKNNQKRSFVNSNFITVESNLNTESSRELDIYPSHRFNQHRNQSTRSIQMRHRRRRIFPSFAINQRQVVNN